MTGKSVRVFPAFLDGSISPTLLQPRPEPVEGRLTCGAPRFDKLTAGVEAGSRGREAASVRGSTKTNVARECRLASSVATKKARFRVPACEGGADPSAGPKVGPGRHGKGVCRRDLSDPGHAAEVRVSAVWLGRNRLQCRSSCRRCSLGYRPLLLTWRHDDEARLKVLTCRVLPAVTIRM